MPTKKELQLQVARLQRAAKKRQKDLTAQEYMNINGLSEDVKRFETRALEWQTECLEQKKASLIAEKNAQEFFKDLKHVARLIDLMLPDEAARMLQLVMEKYSR